MKSAVTAYDWPRAGGAAREGAVAALDHVLGQMNEAFPDACLSDRSWMGHVAAMTNDSGDRHVLAEP